MEKEKIHPVSIIMVLKGLKIKDLPISKPTYYSLIYGNRKSYPQTMGKLAEYFGLTMDQMRKSLRLEKKKLIEK